MNKVIEKANKYYLQEDRIKEKLSPIFYAFLQDISIKFAKLFSDFHKSLAQ